MMYEDSQRDLKQQSALHGFTWFTLVHLVLAALMSEIRTKNNMVCKLNKKCSRNINALRCKVQKGCIYAMKYFKNWWFNK